MLWLFLRYEDKRWVAKEGREIPPPVVHEEKAPPPVQHTERKTYQTPVARVNLRVPPKGPEPVSVCHHHHHHQIQYVLSLFIYFNLTGDPNSKSRVISSFFY